jgi:tetratricopeptide (TPR) repeat protein
MAVRESRRTRREDEEDTRDQWTETEDSDQRDGSDNGSSPNRQMVRAPDRRVSARSRVVHGEVFDPRRAVPIGLLRLARSWSDTGSVYQAIHAYTEVLIRYPQTGAAEAAAEELLILADRLAQQGRYYAALNIFNKLEQLW